MSTDNSQELRVILHSQPCIRTVSTNDFDLFDIWLKIVFIMMIWLNILGKMIKAQAARNDTIDWKWLWVDYTFSECFVQ